MKDPYSIMYTLFSCIVYDVRATEARMLICDLWGCQKTTSAVKELLY